MYKLLSVIAVVVFGLTDFWSQLLCCDVQNSFDKNKTSPSSLSSSTSLTKHFKSKDKAKKASPKAKEKAE